jgi:hypothetical protein
MRSLGALALISVTVALGCASSRSGSALDLGFADGIDPNDHDGDGVTPAEGDCDDNNPLVGPNSIELANNHIDDNCNGMVDEPILPCDSATVGQKDAASLAAALGFCDPHFLLGASFNGPSDERARNVVNHFGMFTNKEGAGMVLMSTGIAADAATPGYVRPQIGTILDQNNMFPNPDITLPGVPGCGSSQPATVNDYTDLAVKLRVPMNVRSMTFQLQFFSAEYPEFVCTAWNDELLVELDSARAPGTTHNISFDAMMNPITVNNSFFTICQNDSAKPQTQHCTQAVDALAGTGYEEILLGKPVGGSTGWLRTSAPVLPGDIITLHFMIFDEGDHIYDSAALLDGFAWSIDDLTAPVTVK